MKHDYSILLHFLRTGELEELKIGMTVDEAIAFLGKADDRKQDERGQTTITYGCLQLHIYDKNPDKIAGIMVRLQDYPEYDLPARLSNRWIPGIRAMSIIEFREFSQQHDIQFSDKPIYVQYKIPQRPSYYMIITHNQKKLVFEGTAPVDRIYAYTG